MTALRNAPKPALTSVLVRIERARTHLADFDNQVRPISGACNLTRECDEQRSEYIFRLSKVPAVPPVLSAIIGDALHNLRVSLDYLAWQLVLATGEKPPTSGRGGTSFPVCKKPRNAEDGSHVYPDIKPGVSMAVRTLLDEIQPYKRQPNPPESHDLAILNALDINDKHHELLVAIVGAQDNVMAFWADNVEPIGFDVGPYADGSEVCRFRYSAGMDCASDFTPSMRFTVCLSDPAAAVWENVRLSATDLVRRPLDYIEKEVLPRFQGFF